MHSGHVDRRAYIGLSTISECERVIYDRYLHGEHPATGEHLKFRVGFELEEALINRLRAMKIYTEGECIQLFDGLVQGHTDGVIRGVDVLEIKTVPLENFIPRPGKIPAKVYWQVQAYMRFTRRNFAQVIYLARDSGLTEVFSVRASEPIARKIELKLERLVHAVRTLERPACTCGRCK